MSATSKTTNGHADNELAALGLGAVLVVAAAIVGPGAVYELRGFLDGHRHGVENPASLTFALAQGEKPWTGADTALLAALVLVLVALVGLVLWPVLRARSRSVEVDRAARHMGHGKTIAGLMLKGAKEKAARFGVSAPGLPLGKTVRGGQPLYASWEDVCLAICGPRTGKTVAYAVPAILAAPGAVIATSNKRDIVDATREVRTRALIGPVRVFDPQDIVGESASWWWNPLSYITDETTAARLAEVFASAKRDPNAKVDGFFEESGQALLSTLLLAAAVGDRPITVVHEWLNSPLNKEPVQLLQAAGFPLKATELAGLQNAPEEQRGGVFATAAGVVMFLTNRDTARWITRTGPDDDRPEFDPAALIAQRGTLYSMSKEGQGTCGALVGALTMAVCDAAETAAKVSPGGRLTVPLVCVLDEAANVCRWKELPNLYSHFGSRGIVVLTILQSWSQGVEAWGRDGMRKLWSAANCKIYGGGVAEVEFLGEMSQLIGDFDQVTTSTSHNRNGRSTSRSTRRERILDVADLGKMPRGRAVLFASGSPATLVRTVPWMDGPNAAEIRASLSKHDPATGKVRTAREEALEAAL